MKEIVLSKSYITEYLHNKKDGETIAQYTHRVYPNYFKEERKMFKGIYDYTIKNTLTDHTLLVCPNCHEVLDKNSLCCKHCGRSFCVNTGAAGGR